MDRPPEGWCEGRGPRHKPFTHSGEPFHLSDRLPLRCDAKCSQILNV